MQCRIMALSSWLSIRRFRICFQHTLTVDLGKLVKKAVMDNTKKNELIIMKYNSKEII